jgi:hypothetical protein
MTEHQFASTCDFVKVDDQKGLVFGFAVVCKVDGEVYIDHQNDSPTEEAMFNAALGFMRKSRMATDMHARDQDGNPIPNGEGVIFAFPLTTEIAKSMDIVTKRTGLMIMMKPSPDVLAKFKGGTYTGFSIGGRYVVNEEATL